MLPQSAFREFLRRFVVALVVTFALTAGGIGSAYWVFNDKLDSANRADVELDDEQQGKPANYLIIGSDTRSFVDDAADEEHFGSTADAGGQRSDTIMVAHVDPDTETGLLVSFPRDLWVDVPGLGGAKLNAAFNEGPQRVVDTLQQNFDIPIHHYIEVDFDGFRGLVDAVGGVPISFPTPARDTMTGLDIAAAGCHELDGQQALAYVRSRQYEWQDAEGEWHVDGTADLGRIQRQQYFTRSLADAAVRAGFRNPLKINDIVNQAVDNMTIDPALGLSDLRALANTFREVDPAVVEMVTVPTEPKRIEGQAALVVRPAEAAPIFERLRNFGDPEPEQIEPPADLAPAEVAVGVRNGSGVAGQARTALDDLAAAGFAAVEPPGNADRADYDRTEIRHPADGAGAAALVHAHLGGAGTLVEVDELPEGVDVLVVLGADFVAVGPPASAPPSSAAAPATTTTSGPPANPGGATPPPRAGC